MSFKLFIYYCALCGGWAAFLAWIVVQLTGLQHLKSTLATAALTGALLGAFLAAAIGYVDALQNAPVGLQRVLRVGVCAGVGLFGGMVGGFVGDLLSAFLPLFIGWMITGAAIGASLGVFDILQARREGQEVRLSLRKTINGVYGGLLGGFVGGVLFWMMMKLHILPLSTLAFALVILGIAIGLLIGLAQVVLKEAWILVESGRRAGRQIILTREETVIGRAESCDIGLFGETGVEREHARILLEERRYLIQDENTPAGTFVNEVRVTRPTPLRAGDAIRIGSCVLRFGEREKSAPPRGT